MTINGPSSRATFLAYTLIAHFIGLLTVGLYGSIGTTAGFGSGLDAILFVGWASSLPWLAILMFVIGRWGAWLSKHVLTFCLIGPLVVCGSSFLLLGTALLWAVAMTSIVGSVVFLAMSLAYSFSRQRSRSPAKAGTRSREPHSM